MGQVTEPDPYIDMEYVAIGDYMPFNSTRSREVW